MANGHYGAAAEFAARELGGPIVERERTVQVGLASQEIVAAEPEQVGIIIVNLSAATVWVAPGLLVSSTRGIRLPPSGGSVSLNVRDDFTLVTRAWHAIASAALSDVYVLSIRRESITPKEV